MGLFTLFGKRAPELPVRMAPMPYRAPPAMPDAPDAPDALPQAEATPATEEAAVLYGLGHGAMAEALLQGALDASGEEALLACTMLFDLYEADGRQADFEQLALHFARRFETSPPSWRTPQERSAAGDAEDEAMPLDAYRLPATITERCHAQLEALAGYAALHDPAVFDARALQRMDFHAASVLQAMLTPIAARGRSIEMRALNHLVLALLKVVGLHSIVRLTPRR